MDFSQALASVKNGKKITRAGWNGKEMFVFLLDLRERDVSEFLAIKDVNNKTVPWLASQTDILAEDWELV